MSTDRDLERIVRSWMDEGVTQLPDRVLDLVLHEIPATPQRRATWLARRFLPMNRNTRLGLIAAAVLAVVIVGIGLFGRTDVGPPVPTPSVAPSPTPTASQAKALRADGTYLLAGTYKTAFAPPLTLTVDEGVAALDGCDVSHECIQTTNVNSPVWLDMVLGRQNGVEFSVNRMDKFYDPSAPGTLFDPPDAALLITQSPGVTVLRAPTPITIGGLTARELDVWAHQGLTLGPVAGVSRPDVTLLGLHEVRVIIVVVDNFTVLILEQIGPWNTSLDFQAAVNSLQPLIDSIKWQ